MGNEAAKKQEADMALCRTLGEQVMVNDALITDLEGALNLPPERRTNIERLNPHRPSGAHGQIMPNDYGDPTYYAEWLRRQTKTLRGLLNVWHTK